MPRKMELWQTAGFSERSHKYFMKSQNGKACLDIMNRMAKDEIWWGSYRYHINPAFNGLQEGDAKYYGW